VGESRPLVAGVGKEKEDCSSRVRTTKFETGEIKKGGTKRSERAKQAIQVMEKRRWEFTFFNRPSQRRIGRLENTGEKKWVKYNEE